MRHLAIFLHDFSATGVVRNALAIARHMAQRGGWQVTLVAARAEGVLLQGALESGAGIVALLEGDPAGQPARRRLDLVRSVPKLRRWIGRVRPDAILSAGNHGHVTVWAATRAIWPRPAPRRIYRISNDLNRRGDGRSPGARLRHLMHGMLVRDAWRVALVSPRLADDRIFAGALATGRARIIRNGVDIDRVRALATQRPDHPAMAGDMPVVLGVGRLVRQKNFAVLIDAVARARQVMPMRLVLLGDGSEEARAALRAQADALGMAQALVLAPGCDNPFAYMARAAVVALPSVWEGSPNVLLEAMACGTPVVAARTAGNAAEILEDGRHGRLVDPDDPAALAEALIAQMDPARRVLPGARAADFALPVTLAAYGDMIDGLPPDVAGAPGGEAAVSGARQVQGSLHPGDAWPAAALD